MPIARILPWLISSAMITLACLFAWSTADARQGDQTTTIFVGSALYTDGTATTTGTTFGVKWALEFEPDWLWSISGQYSAAEGEEESGGQKYNLSAQTSTVQSGLTYLVNNHPKSVVVGLLGGGLSILWYELDFDYPGSDIGRTSGVGPGAFVLAGVEIRVAKNIEIIPEYVISAHSIETEAGDRFSLVSAGLQVAIRLKF